MALAPDPASASAGKGLAGEKNWVSSGYQGDAVWGEAQGSGKLPYQTAVDLSGIAYKCSCPSRKIPCKHALGLLLRLVGNQLKEADPPTWVSEWLDKRGEKAAKKAEPAAPPNPEAQAARAEKRWQTILNGLDECEAFLEDAVAQGLVASTAVRSWDQMAARMVDAQAPGVANRLLSIGNVLGVGSDWPERAARQLGSLTLLIEAARSIDRLGKPLQADVRTELGISVRVEDIEGDPVADVWDVVGQDNSYEGRLTVHRSWLKGRKTGRWAAQVTYVVAGQVSAGMLVPGTSLEGSVRFYESAWPLRVHMGTMQTVPFSPRPGGNCEVALVQAAAGWAKSPWIESFPVHISGARLAKRGRDLLLLDQEGHALPLPSTNFSPLLARTGNRPFELFGAWSGRLLVPLAAWGSWGFERLA